MRKKSKVQTSLRKIFPKYSLHTLTQFSAEWLQFMINGLFKVIFGVLLKNF